MTKRARIDCDGDACGRPECESCWIPAPALANPPPVDYAAIVSKMDESTVRSILSSLALTSHGARGAIWNSYRSLQPVSQLHAYEQQIEDEDEEGEYEDGEDEEDYDEDEEEEENFAAGPTGQCETSVINFDQFSKSAWHSLNTSYYTKLSSSKQYDASFDAYSAVEDCVQAIRKQVKANSSYGTKLNALETLREIADTVLSAGDTLGREVRKEFQYDNCVVNAMLDIAEFMTPEERLKAGQNDADGKGTLLDKLDEVDGEAGGLCIEGLQVGGVTALLGGGD